MKKLIVLLLLSTSAFASLINNASVMVDKNSTIAAKQAATLTQIQGASTRAFQVLQQSVTQAFNLVWKNWLGLTPQQALTAEGKDACAGHLLLLAASQILNAASPGSFTLVEPVTVTCNSDGSITLPVPSPSPSASPSP